MVAGGWDDRGCAEKYPFVCFNENKTGNARYIYNSLTLTWYDAQCYCRQYHTDLASTRDETEYSIIPGVASPSSFYTWFGLYRDSWKWVDQTNFSTISWMPGSPDNALKNENCGYLSNNQAADAQCSELKPFFCYAVVTSKKQIMRMKIRANQDVSAFMTAILEKIEQKLKDYGMAENIRMKWRVIR
ncbi:C-type lectin-like [Hemibagrus wyckioides]|nr:C-type lectin-like [Hemibagrus wyckioides]